MGPMFPGMSSSGSISGSAPSITEIKLEEVKVETTAPTATNVVTPATKVVKRPPRVLVVDDDPMVLLAVGSMLKRLRCEVSTAANGEQAVEQVADRNNTEKENPIELVIMDANMPVMNGYDAAREITKMIREGKIQPAKIICLSAQDSCEHMKLCKDCGMEYVGITFFGGKREKNHKKTTKIS